MMTSKMKAENFKSYQSVITKARKGDMIEFSRTFYNHWAIYIGNGQIIHLWGDKDSIGESIGKFGIMTIYGIEFNKAEICKSKIRDIMDDSRDVRINNSLDSEQKPLPIRDILERAENAVGRIGYNLLYNNCEHFATECRYGQATSKQVQAGVSGSVLGLGIILTGAAIFGAYLLSDSSHDEEEKKMKKIQIKS